MFWDAVLTVHLKGHMSTCHHAVKHWRELGKAGETVAGRIINTASESGLYGQAGQVNYATAKAGIVAMTIVIAREMKKYGVTANVVCPRARTRMTETVAGASEFMAGPEWSPDNISPVVAFLASDAAADVSGQVFVVFGSRVHLMEGWHLVKTLDRGEGRWTPEELLARKKRRDPVSPQHVTHRGAWSCLRHQLVVFARQHYSTSSSCNHVPEAGPRCVNRQPPSSESVR